MQNYWYAYKLIVTKYCNKNEHVKLISCSYNFIKKNVEHFN